MTNARDRALAPPTATPPIGATRGALTPAEIDEYHNHGFLKTRHQARPLLDVYLMHGANPNRSPHRRAALAIRYVPWTCDIDQALFSPRPLWLVRGQYRTGRNDFDICHDRA